MNEKPVTKAVAKRFLLGAVDDSDRQQIESLLIVDPETEETILIAEDELVEEYLEGTLSESDRAGFLKQYAYGPRQRRKLRITESIREYAQAEALQGQSESSALQKLQRFFSLRWPTERKLSIPLAVAVAVVLIVTAAWLVKWNSDRMLRNNLQMELVREVTELNTPANLSQNPPQMLSLVLPSVSLRSVNSPAEVTPQTGQRFIELQLLWPQKEESESYLAVLRRVGGTEEFKIPNLHVERKPGGKIVRLRLPSQSLARGLYNVSLTAIASDGSSGPAEEYNFIIGG